MTNIIFEIGVQQQMQVLPAPAAAPQFPNFSDGLLKHEIPIKPNQDVLNLYQEKITLLKNIIKSIKPLTDKEIINLIKSLDEDSFNKLMEGLKKNPDNQEFLKQALDNADSKKVKIIANVETPVEELKKVIQNLASEPLEYVNIYGVQKNSLKGIV